MAYGIELHRRAATRRENWMSLLIALFARTSRAAPRLDMETLPDHLKRDLGFLDGRGVSRRDDF